MLNLETFPTPASPPLEEGPLNPARGQHCKFWCIRSLKSDIWWQQI